MEKINIAELLKDCPSDMELDCTMYDNLYFDEVDDYDKKIHCYIQYKDHRTCIVFGKYGTYNSEKASKCVIFPKGKTTWEGFVPPCKFKDGDILTTNINSIFIFSHLELDRISDRNMCKAYVGIRDTMPIDLFHTEQSDTFGPYESMCRLATEEEKTKLFQAIKDNGYKWNPETKTLEKLPTFKVGDRIVRKDGICVPILITKVSDEYYYSDTKSSVGVLSISEQDEWELVPNKFDITTLVPFESRVLIRDNKLQKWSPAVWGFYDPDTQDYQYKLIGVIARYCIPYKGNEHLLGTTNDCDEYFKSWEIM